MGAIRYWRVKAVNEYLIEFDKQDRENEAVRRLLELPFIANGIFEPLGLFSYFS